MVVGGEADFRALQHRFQLQHAVATTLSEAENTNQGLNAALAAMADILGAEIGLIWIVDDSAQALRCRGMWLNPSLASLAFDPLCNKLAPQLTASAPITTRLADHVEWPVAAGDYITPDSITLAVRADMDYALVVPVATEQRVLGHLELFSKNPTRPDPATVELCDALGRQIAAFVVRQEMLAAEVLARKEAEEANNLQLKFLAMISHELRTPLTSIKGFATTLLADDVAWDPSSQREFLSIINSEADTLTELIEQLLDLSRLEAGLLRINPGAHDLNSIISAAIPQLYTLTQAHALSIHVPDNLPPIWADARRISQVLTNLVSNAAKYSPASTAIVVNVSLSQTSSPGGSPGDFVQVSVADQGPGIPEQERARVFKPFQRGEGSAARNTSGTGLGLAICKGIVEAHGGHIWIEGVHGQGTTIAFTIPARKP